KRKSYTVGASADLAGGTLKAQYTNSNDDAPNADATMVAVGYDYHLRKDTTVYVAYASTNNDANAKFMANDWGHGQAVTPVAGKDPSSISLGVVYKFGIGL
ncbi:MAG: porin, partial [Gammaproteobacteria bacterium]